jgi:NitT/TauT family transport system substrate-binding protein
MTAVMSVPRAKEMGLELRVLSTALRYHKSGDGAHVWVKKGSPYKTIHDLKGKTIATYGLQSTGVTLVRLALWKKYGVNVQFENGDFKWQQLPAPALPGALATDKVEGATLIHSQAYQASKTGDFVPVAKTAEDMYELFKLRMVSAVNVGYAEKIAAKPELYREFNRMLKASVDYTLKNIGEVSEAVGKETKNDPAYFKAWFEQYSDFPAAVSQNDIDAMNKVWALSKELGVLKDFPDAKTMIWEGAIRE